MSKPTITIDGTKFANLAEFFSHFQAQALGGAKWGTNLDAFNDVLRGGFGSPEGGFILVWENHELSKDQLGYKETQRQLRRRLKSCHPENIARVQAELALAASGHGSTVYDWLLGIIRTHGPGGEEQEDGIELVLR